MLLDGHGDQDRLRRLGEHGHTAVTPSRAVAQDIDIGACSVAGLDPGRC